MAGTTTKNHDSLSRDSIERQAVIQFNKLVTDVSALVAAGNGTGNVTVVTPTIGSTVTVAVPASVISIDGVRTLIAAETAKAFGALGTIPTGKWGLIALERVAAATTTFVSAAANYTTGYATEALALAAIPAITASKVRVGYLTILATTPGWVAGTDALAGGTGGTPATTTNYYPGTGMFDATLYLAGLLGNEAGTAISVL